MIRFVACLFVFCACLPGLARADALVQTLPADGSWVRFQVNFKAGDEETHPIWSIQSVGTKMIDQEKYRWIELQAAENDRLGQVVKLLIAEKEFGAGKNPLSKPKQVWFQFGPEGKPVEVSSIAERDPALAILIAGPTTNVKKREQKETIKYQNGEFESEVFEGLNSSELFGSKLEMSHTVWKHADVPFGITAMKQSMKFVSGNSTMGACIDMTLKDFGKDAKTALTSVE